MSLSLLTKSFVAYFIVPFFVISLLHTFTAIDVIYLHLFMPYLMCFCLFAVLRSRFICHFPHYRGDIAWALIYFCVSLPLVLLFGKLVAWFLDKWLDYSDEVQQLAVKIYQESMLNPYTFFFQTLALILFVPIAEELLFRGLIQNYLKRYCSAQGAILASSLFFAVCHFSESQGWGNLEILAALFLFSLFLGALYEKRQSILAPILLHVTFNSVNVIMMLYFERF